MRIVAIIPVKHVSERVLAKNFRDFYEGQSLLEIKIQQVKACELFDEIYVSSDSPEAERIANEYQVKFLKRDPALCNNVTPWSDVIYEVILSLPESEDAHVAWCHTTSPMFSNFRDCISRYTQSIQEGVYNGLVAVSECNEFILDDTATPVNYSWGPWHKYSQFLKKYFFVSGAIFIAGRAEMIKNRYVISTNPYLFQTSSLESIDIDTEFDYEFAKYAYGKLMVGSSI